MASASPHVFLITGNDDTQIRRAAEALVRQFAGDDPDPFSFDMIQQGESGPSAAQLHTVINSIRQPPFLGGHKTIWLKHFTGFDMEGSKTAGEEAAAIAELAALITKGLPDDVVLIMDGPGVDGRKALSKACQKHGQLQTFNRPDKRNSSWRDDMLNCLSTAAQAKGLRLGQEVMDYLLDALGTDTAAIDQELEKLICYAGGLDKTITLDDARMVCSGRGEELIWTLGDTLGSRNVSTVLNQAETLVLQSADSEGPARTLLYMTGRFFMTAIRLRVFMQEKKLKTGRDLKTHVEGMSAEAKKAAVEEGFEFISMHPYRIKLLADQSLKFQPREIMEGIRIFRNALWQTMSSGTSARVALENALVQVVRPAAATAFRPR